MWFSLATVLICSTVSAYKWTNVKIGGGGGFIPGIIFHPEAKGVAYARTDIGGLYRLNSDHSWTPLQDAVNNSNWHNWGVNGIGLDASDASKVYISVGMYTNNYDPNPGSILRSSDYGTTWAETKLSFKLPGNQPGRGVGERLVVDPNNGKIIFLAAPSGRGLWQSYDQGVTFSQVPSFTAVGTFRDDPTDTLGLDSDLIGLTGIAFDTTSAVIKGATSVIYVGTANINESSVYFSNDAGSTWSPVPGQPQGLFPKRMKFSTKEKALYITYNNRAGPYNAGMGSVYRYSRKDGWKDITPSWQAKNNLTFGYGGLALDENAPGTLMVASDVLWSPDVQISRSTDSGNTWTNIWDYNATTYTYDTNKAPWIKNSGASNNDTKVLGWMVASLEIDPFDSNHWLYGTGMTIYGGFDLMNFPRVHVQSLADGVEEEAVNGLIAPPGGAPLLSAVEDIGGFRHAKLDVSPNNSFQNPFYITTTGIDYAGTNPHNIVRIGYPDLNQVSQMALSSDGGVSWSPTQVPLTSITGGKVAYGADAINVVWISSNSIYRFSNGAQSLVLSSSGVSSIAADKVDGNYFYAADSDHIYISNDGGATFSTTDLSNGGVSALVVNPIVAGDVWISSSSGIYHSTNYGKSFTQLASVSTSYAIAIGKGAGANPNIYGFVTATGSNTNMLQLSTDLGVTWTPISDSGYGFGSSEGNCLAASLDVAGQVFVGTNGRGIFYGLP